MTGFGDLPVVREVSRRARQIRRLFRRDGFAGLRAKVVRSASKRLLPAELPTLDVLPTDVLAADLRTPRLWAAPSRAAGERLVVNWVSAPPAEGSGGHTTMFRLVQHLESLGHTCRLYLYDIHGGDERYYTGVVRAAFPGFRGEVYDVTEGMLDADAVFATSWQTAYPVYRSASAGKRYYLVQDFEPFFYPVGGQSALSENTYRMGFHAVTVGRWLAGKLQAEYGMAADPFEFGCDLDRYFVHDRPAPRDGVVFYARPEAARRAFDLGVLALQLFAERHPEITIHLYGQSVRRLPFPFEDHGLVTPDGLNDIYNRCFAGLSLSMTNVSLVPHEMLAAGCIPVVNEAEHNRIVLDNPHVHYAAATPHHLAEALGQVVEDPDFGVVSKTAAGSVRGLSWSAAGDALAAVLERNVGRPA